MPAPQPATREQAFASFIPKKLPSGRDVPEAWKQALTSAGAFGQPYKLQPDIPQDGIGIDLLDATNRMYPRKHADYNSIKAERVGAIHDSGIMKDMPHATREWMRAHGKAGMSCEAKGCGNIQTTGEKASLKRCSRVRDQVVCAGVRRFCTENVI